MANNNVQNIKFLRNGTLFGTRDLALQGMNGQLSNLADGTAILGRYGSGNDVKTLVGFVYDNGNNKSLTVFDVEGASADVEALRQEINAKLGNGIGSGTSETVTAQLTALSGNGQSTSAETSVEGAKRYADELKNQMDYSGVTTGDGVYVTNVTQSDGIVSATTATLPTVTDAKEAKRVVVSVSEDKGEISIERGTISSSAETMVLTDNADGGVNFEVNIDNETIIQDAETKKLKVADTALVQYVGDEDTIHISAVDAQNNKTVSSLLTISATTPTEANVKEQYNLVGASGNTIGATIKIYKDSSLYRAYLGHVDDTITSATDPTVVPGSGDTALCFIYLKTDGTYELVAVNVEEFIEENEFASGVTWDNIAKKVKGVVDTESEKDSQDTPVDFLTVGENGFKISGIKNEIDRQLDAVVEDLDATVTGATSGNHVTITVEEVDGKLVQSGLTIEENDIASASDLAELSGKTVIAITSNNDSITAAINDAAGNKSYNIETDASKIKMSGFTAETSGFTAITEASTVAEAVKAIETEVIANEHTTAAALTDLDGRLDVVEGEYISGVSVNGNAVTVANHVAPISITAATSAATPTSTEAIVVTAGNDGSITLALADIDAGVY